MTTPHDLDRQLDAFLLDGPTELPDVSFDAVRDRTEVTRQRAVIGPWRVPDMSKFIAVGLGAAAVVAVLLVGGRILGAPAPNQPGAGPSLTPSSSAEPSEAAPSVEPSSATQFLPEGSFPIEEQTGPVRITVTIPSSGWSSNPDFEAIGKGDDGDPPEAALLAWSNSVGTGFSVYGDPCHWQSTTPDTPAITVEEIVSALSAQTSRDASEPVDVSIGGYSGKSITLHVPNDAPTRAEAFKDCDQETFASYGYDGDPTPARFHQGPGQIDELWILDVDGAIVILDAMYRPDTPATLLEELRTVAESATFEQLGP